MSDRVLATDDGDWIAIRDGRVVPAPRGPDDEARPAAPADAEQLGDVRLVAGFVDLQVNGVGDVDFWTADPDGWVRAGTRLVAGGVTSYLPTLTTAPLAAYDDGLARVTAAQAAARERNLPRIEGVHLEGPFLGGAPGAHPVELIRPMDVEWLTRLVDRHPGLVRLVTLAPEADPDLAGVRALAERGIVVSLGHSTCSSADALAAAGAGATMVTHLFNGMSPLHHREPGLAGAGLDGELGLYAGLIADLVHVDGVLVDVAMASARVALVTDAVATGGRYHGQQVVERDGAAYLADGTLTGSTLTMDQAVRNVARRVDLQAALDAASTVPAAVLGLDAWDPVEVDGSGRADLVALHVPTECWKCTVERVWIEGEAAYPRA